MKTRFILMAMFATLAISCAKEILPENNVADNTDVALVSMEFVAGLESKAAIVDGEKTVEWVAGDQICVFDNLGGDNAFKTEASGETVSFAGQVSGGANEFYALYPYRSGAEFNAETKVVTSKLFPEQKAVLGSYAKAEGGAVMAAKVSDGNVLSFKNMTSHIRFTLAEDLEDVISITLMGNKGEALAGLYTVDFNDEVPVLTVSKAETYVTLRNEDGSVLEPGDYFFTVLPVEFTEGFTVILSMSDGSQLAKKTTKSITSLGERNKVLPMAKLNYSDYKPHMNYFVLYNDGFELTFGGYTFDKTTQPDAKRIAESNSSIGVEGVYFVSSSVSATVDHNNKTSLIIIGEDSSQRSTVNQDKNPQPQTADCVFVCANLNYSCKRIEPKGSFGKLIFDNCKLIISGDGFLRMNGTSLVVNDFVITDSDVEIINPKATFNFATGNTAGTKVVNTKLYNNVFYINNSISDLTGFVLLNEGNASTVDYANIEISYNTFDKTVIGNNFVTTKIPSTLVDVNHNVFLESNVSGGVKYLFATAPTEISVKDNFCYIGSYTRGIQFYKDFAGNNPKNIDDPRVSGWAPINGVCGLNTIVYNDKSYVAGAQRGTSAESANYAAAGYSSVNLGNY